MTVTFAPDYKPSKKATAQLIAQLPPHLWPEVKLTKLKTTASRHLRHTGDPRKNTQAAHIAHKMAANGVVGPKPGKKHTPEEQLEQFVMLENIGTPTDVIIEVLKISPSTARALRQRARDLYVSAVVEDGVMGAIGAAFHRIDLASKKVTSLIPLLEGPRNGKALIEATRALVAFESQKIGLLVQTGAVKVKRKIEIHENLDQTGAGGDPPLMSGAAAMRILNLIESTDADLPDPRRLTFDDPLGERAPGDED